jgi:hypothetical protein
VYHSFSDYDWRKLGPVRMHRFLTGREAGGIKPIFGLTAYVVIIDPITHRLMMSLEYNTDKYSHCCYVSVKTFI